MQSSRPLKTSWLVTWEWMGDHARIEKGKEIVAVFNYTWSGERVRLLVEQLYLSFGNSVWDMIKVARNKRGNPYPAEFENVNGVPWHGSIRCGHNPSLHARLVRNLHVILHDDGSQEYHWEEIS